MTRASWQSRATILMAGVLAVGAGPGLAQGVTATRPIETFWVTDGTVQSVYNQGTRVYFGGQFRVVAPPNGAFSPIDASSGAPLAGFPKVDGGDVLAVVPDGAGGWFIGGSFTTVAGLSRPGLARILGDGRLSSWTPGAGPNAAVRALARKGAELFVGGDFTNLGGASGPSYLAKLNVLDGALVAWSPQVAGGSVRALLLAGTRLYLGGRFNLVGGSTRCGAAAVNPSSAALDIGWDAGLSMGAGCGELNALALTTGGKIMIGGRFDKAGATTTVRHLAEVDPATGAETGVTDHFVGPVGAAVFALAVAPDGRTYVGGSFTDVDAAARGRLAVLSPTGGLEAWDGAADGGVSALAVDVANGRLLVGGSFHSVSAGSPSVAESRHYAAALTLATSIAPPGHVPTFLPNPNGAVAAFATSGGKLGAGGVFAGIGGAERVNVAAVSVPTGALVTSWNPKISPESSTVFAVAPGVTGADPTILLGGDFDQVNGSPQKSLAGVKSSDGSTVTFALAPAFGAGDVVRALAHDTNASGGQLYVGGTIANKCGGSPCTHVLRLNGDTGALDTTWSQTASASNTVEALWASTSPGRVLAGGSFTSIGGANRRAVAELSPGAGAALPIDPDPRGGGQTVFAVLPGGANQAYFAGSFTSILGLSQLRSNAAAAFYNGISTDPIGWIPSTDNTVYAMTDAPGSDFYLGGAFSAPTTGLARVTLASGSSTGWTPQAPNAPVLGLGKGFSTIVAGGAFTTLGGDKRQGLAAFCENQSPPSDVGATINGPNSIKVTWTGLAGTVYRVFRALGANGGWVPLGLVSSTGGPQAYDDNQAEGGATYRYMVRVEQGSPGPCLSDPSNIATNSTNGTCNLPPHFDGAALAELATAESFCAVRVWWQPAAPACFAATPTYSVYRDTAPGFVPSASNRLVANWSFGSPYTDSSDVAGGATYYYVVRATDPSNGEEEPNQVYAEAVVPPGCNALPTAPAKVPVVTVKSWSTGGANSGNNEVTWLTPTTGGGLALFCALACEATSLNPGSCTPAGGIGAGSSCGAPANSAVSRTETGLVPGSPRNYVVFRQYNLGPFTSVYASGRPDGATPDESWAFSTGQSALGTPALYPGISYVSASNNRRIHAMTPGAAGGSWPAGWIPPAMNAPSQLGPIYLPATTALGNPSVLLASSDGRVYAFDASSGAPEWASPSLAPNLVAKPSVMFAEAYPGAANRVFIGTRDSTGPNSLRVLDLVNGGSLWSFPSVAGGTGVIHAPALVDYAGNRVYFGSRRRVGGSSNTLWCVSVPTQAPCGNWGTDGGIDVGEIDVPLSLRNGRLYYLTTAGTLGSVDVANPSGSVHTFPVGGNPKGMWTFDAGGGHVRAIVSTGTNLRLVDDDTLAAGSMSAVAPFDGTPVGTALSAPVLGPGPGYHVWVGDSGGQLRAFLLADGSEVTPARILGATSATIGTPRRDVNTGMLIAGGSDGVVYAVPEF